MQGIALASNRQLALLSKGKIYPKSGGSEAEGSYPLDDAAIEGDFPAETLRDRGGIAPPIQTKPACAG